MDKSIPLSELIRIGSKVTTQCRQQLFGMNESACALGAAIVAKRGMLPSQISKVNCQSELGVTPSLIATIIHWNDYIGLTREEIADRLEIAGH